MPAVLVGGFGVAGVADAPGGVGGRNGAGGSVGVGFWVARWQAAGFSVLRDSSEGEP